MPIQTCKPHPYFKDGLPVVKKACLLMQTTWVRLQSVVTLPLPSARPPPAPLAARCWVLGGKRCRLWGQAGRAKDSTAEPVLWNVNILFLLAWSDASFFILMYTLSVYHVKYGISLWQI